MTIDRQHQPLKEVLGGSVPQSYLDTLRKPLKVVTLADLAAKTIDELKGAMVWEQIAILHGQIKGEFGKVLAETPFFKTFALERQRQIAEHQNALQESLASLGVRFAMKPKSLAAGVDLFILNGVWTYGEPAPDPEEVVRNLGTIDARVRVHPLFKQGQRHLEFENDREVWMALATKVLEKQEGDAFVLDGNVRNLFFRREHLTQFAKMKSHRFILMAGSGKMNGEWLYTMGIAMGALPYLDPGLYIAHRGDIGPALTAEYNHDEDKFVWPGTTS